MRDCYNEWMANEVHQLTPAGRIRKPSYATVAQWVKKSWDDIDSNLMRKAFKCCGVLVRMDGTEDELVFDYEGLVKEDSDESLIVDFIDGETYNEVEDYENDWTNEE